MICVNQLYLSAPVCQNGGDDASWLGSKEASSAPDVQPDQTDRDPPCPGGLSEGLSSNLYNLIKFGRATDAVRPLTSHKNILM